MTIRTRLWVSHIIALIVPIIMTIIIVSIALSGLYLYIARGNYMYVGNLSQYNNASQLLTYITFCDFKKGDQLEYAPILYRLFDPYTTYIRVTQNGEPVYYYGNLRLTKYIPPEVLKDTSSLRVYSKEAVYYTHVTRSIRDVDYSLTLFAINRPDKSDKKVEFFVKTISIIIILAILLSIYLINLFLTRFTMHHILMPLKGLTKGAREVAKGDLNTHVPHETNDEFRIITDQFNFMIRSLRTNKQEREQREMSRRQLIAGISHDVRTPLTSIKAYVEGLIDKVPKTEEERQRYLYTIQSKTNEMDIMLDQLFLFSKLDIGQEALHIEPVKLHNLLNEYIRDNHDFYSKQGLEIDLTTYNLATVEGDVSVLVRILENLLTNSLKYKNQERGKCHITLSAAGQDAIITVTDDGPGVPEDMLERLFEVFYRTDKARANTNEGSGLGLAIAAKYMALMDGHISASNAYPKGLQITITLPLFHSQRTISKKDTNDNPKKGRRST